MPHIPEQTIRPVGVGAEIEYRVQSESELDHAQVRSEMPAIGADRIDDAIAQFAGKLHELFGRESFEVGRGMNPLEQRGSPDNSNSNVRLGTTERIVAPR